MTRPAIILSLSAGRRLQARRRSRSSVLSMVCYCTLAMAYRTPRVVWSAHPRRGRQVRTSPFPTSPCARAQTIPNDYVRNRYLSMVIGVFFFYVHEPLSKDLLQTRCLNRHPSVIHNQNPTYDMRVASGFVFRELASTRGSSSLRRFGGARDYFLAARQGYPRRRCARRLRSPTRARWVVDPCSCCWLLIGSD